MAMTARERVEAALDGREVDRPPVGLWRHFPERDQTAEDLTASTLEWQSLLDLDFVKLMPPGDYPTIDWGARSEYQGAPGGTRETVLYPVTKPDDWANIQPVPADAGFNAEVVRACGLVRDALGPDIPILQTIFSPLTIANKMSDGLVIEHLRTHPEAVHQALGIIREVTIAVANASLQDGADGVFFASQCATSDLVTRDEYQEFGIVYDEPVLAAARAGGSRFTLVHIHGGNTFFDILAGYDAHALNWHDRRVGPSIEEVLSKYPDRSVVAGIDEKGIVAMTAEEAKRQAESARGEARDRRLLIGPGCVIPVAVPLENLTAVVQSARR